MRLPDTTRILDSIGRPTQVHIDYARQLRAAIPAPLLEAAKAYDVRIVRDDYGVPHIRGKRDADVAYGLAFAHSEDDFLTIRVERPPENDPDPRKAAIWRAIAERLGRAASG